MSSNEMKHMRETSSNNIICGLWWSVYITHLDTKHWKASGRNVETASLRRSALCSCMPNGPESDRTNVSLIGFPSLDSPYSQPCSPRGPQAEKSGQCKGDINGQWRYSESSVSLGTQIKSCLPSQSPCSQSTAIKLLHNLWSWSNDTCWRLLWPHWKTWQNHMLTHPLYSKISTVIARCTSRLQSSCLAHPNNHLVPANTTRDTSFCHRVTVPDLGFGQCYRMLPHVSALKYDGLRRCSSRCSDFHAMLWRTRRNQLMTDDAKQSTINVCFTVSPLGSNWFSSIFIHASQWLSLPPSDPWNGGGLQSSLISLRQPFWTHARIAEIASFYLSKP